MIRVNLVSFTKMDQTTHTHTHTHTRMASVRMGLHFFLNSSNIYSHSLKQKANFLLDFEVFYNSTSNVWECLFPSLSYFGKRKTNVFADFMEDYKVLHIFQFFHYKWDWGYHIFTYWSFTFCFLWIACSYHWSFYRIP